jgi:N-methylhydantoinase B
VLDDVINEKVSIEAAAREYGVVIDAGTMTVDMEKTRALRDQMAQAAR